MRANPLTATGPENLPAASAARRPDPHTRWTKRRGLVIRGAMQAGQRGLFGDGAIGATAVRTGSSVITSDKNFTEVLESLGVDVRVP